MRRVAAARAALVAIAAGLAGPAAMAAPPAVVLTRPYDGAAVLEPSRTHPGQRVERGRLRGVAYTIEHADGAAEFSAAADGTLAGEPWRISCAVEAGPLRVCRLTRRALGVVITSTSPPQVQIGVDAGGAVATIQVDRGRATPAATTTPSLLSAADSLRVLRQLRLATQVTLRHGPTSAQATEESWPVHGFDEAYRYLSWVMAR